MGLCMADSLLANRKFNGSDMRVRFHNWWFHGYASLSCRCLAITSLLPCSCLAIALPMDARNIREDAVIDRSASLHLLCSGFEPRFPEEFGLVPSLVYADVRNSDGGVAIEGTTMLSATLPRLGWAATSASRCFRSSLTRHLMACKCTLFGIYAYSREN